LTDESGRVEFAQVAKRFRKGTRADSLRELLPALGRAVLRGRRVGRDPDEFWALRDVSFTVEPGEVLGLIGANGAGKSTVLRLLTGLLQPDRGTVDVRGRIGALIELAAGFHPELTGRENVFLQGAILGLSRAEIRQRFDAIVAFAEIEEFLDTPVKHYSSGMNARLGFAIAVHAEPDVLLVDEILSVGDRAFQAKAFERLAAEVRRGIPVVVVSHQLERISALCQRALLLSHGTVAFDGPAPECIAAYVAQTTREAELEVGACPVALQRLQIATTAPDTAGATPSTAPATTGGRVTPGTRVALRLAGAVRHAEFRDLQLGVRVWSLPAEQRVAAIDVPAAALALPAAGGFELDLSFAANLGPGSYRLQGVAWHAPSLREWAAGPSVLLEVARAPGSNGSHFLDPRFGAARAIGGL
jgi:lipopolysaccharide transport system ATP-binding protein